MNTANILELVETLEAAEESARTLESRNRRLEGIIDAAESQIAQLESVIKEQDQRLISYAAIATKNAAAASEAQTFTVKLPDLEKWRSVDCVRAQAAYKVLVRKELLAAGIKLQIEE